MTRIVRAAMASDLPSLVPLLEEFHNASSYSRYPFSKSHIEDVLAWEMRRDTALSLMGCNADGSDPCAFLFSRVQRAFTSDLKIISGVFFYVRKDAREGGFSRTLFDQFHAAALVRGVSFIDAQLTGNVETEATVTFLSKLGYSPLQGNYRKTLETPHASSH
jgi:GNAT superfamily N-acetyltransferase